MNRWTYDCVHTGPGTLAGRFMRQFWHPVIRTADLERGQTKPLRIMSEDFTLYRGMSGACALLAPRCPHRGVMLSTGWVEGDDIRCRYHGWTFRSDGQCIEQPAERERQFCAKVKVKTYPTVEYKGLLFAFLGEGEPPVFPEFPELDGDGIIETISYRRNCNITNVLDNQLDEAHFPFAHRRSDDFGDMPTIRVTRTDYGCASYCERPNAATRATEFMMPNVLRLSMLSCNTPPVMGKGVAWRVPIDDGAQYTFGINYYDVPAADRQRIADEQDRINSLPRPPYLDLVDDVLTGRATVEDVVANLPEHNPIHNVHFEDHVVLQAQGVVADRNAEILAATDIGIRVVRDLWNEALAAFAKDGTVRNAIVPAPAIVAGAPATALTAAAPVGALQPAE